MKIALEIITVIIYSEVINYYTIVLGIGSTSAFVNPTREQCSVVHVTVASFRTLVAVKKAIEKNDAIFTN